MSDSQRDFSSSLLFLRTTTGLLSAIPGFIIMFSVATIYGPDVEQFLHGMAIDYIVALIFSLSAVFLNIITVYLYAFLIASFDPEKYGDHAMIHSRHMIILASVLSVLFSFWYYFSFFIGTQYLLPLFCIHSAIMVIIIQLTSDVFAGKSYAIMSVYSIAIATVLAFFIEIWLFSFSFFWFFGLFFPILWTVFSFCSAAIEYINSYIIQVNGVDIFEEPVYSEKK